MSIPELPQDIIDSLVDELSHHLNWDPDCDTSAFSRALDDIRACTQVSRSFRHRARRHLFKHLNVTVWLEEDDSVSTGRILELFQANEELACSVRTLQLIINHRLPRKNEYITVDLIIRDTNAAKLLPLLTHLTSLTVDNASVFKSRWVELGTTLDAAVQELFKNNPTRVLVVMDDAPQMRHVFRWKHLRSLRVESIDPWFTYDGLTTALLPSLTVLDVKSVATLISLRSFTRDAYQSFCSSIETFRLRVAHCSHNSESDAVLDTLKYSSHSLVTVELTCLMIILWFGKFTTLLDAPPVILSHPLTSLQHLHIHEPDSDPDDNFLHQTLDFICALCTSPFLKTVHISIVWVLDDYKTDQMQWLKTTDILKPNSWAALNACLARCSCLESFTLIQEFIYLSTSFREELCDFPSEFDAFGPLSRFTPSVVFPQLFNRPSVAVEVAAMAS